MASDRASLPFSPEKAALVSLVNWQAQHGQIAPFSTVITGAFVSVLPIIAMFLCLQRFWRSGITAGSLK